MWKLFLVSNMHKLYHFFCYLFKDTSAHFYNGLLLLAITNSQENQELFFENSSNFARPHLTLREKVTETDILFKQKWRPRTPGMAAELTDHVWTFRELLTIKFAIIHNQSISGRTPVIVGNKKFPKKSKTIFRKLK